MEDIQICIFFIIICVHIAVAEPCRPPNRLFLHAGAIEAKIKVLVEGRDSYFRMSYDLCTSVVDLHT